MGKGKGLNLPLTLIMALCAVALLAGSVFAQEAVKQPALTPDDCAKCHLTQATQIATGGGAHKVQINCQDCHQGHRPASANNIPQCSMCHTGKKHYELEGCMNCHNPHQPLPAVLKGDLKAACLTCHPGIGQKFATLPSKHAALACNFCHANTHGMIPECVQCHEPHSNQMNQGDCKVCHQAHQPTALTYGPQTPSIFCAACHETAYTLLANTKTKHHDVACVTCHQERHKNIPLCSDCHGLPHAATIHEKFPKCGQCHSIAHDLNRFGEAGAPKKGAPKKETKKENVKKGK